MFPVRATNRAILPVLWRDPVAQRRDHEPVRHHPAPALGTEDGVKAAEIEAAIEQPIRPIMRWHGVALNGGGHRQPGREPGLKSRGSLPGDARPVVRDRVGQQDVHRDPGRLCAGQRQSSAVGYGKPVRQHRAAPGWPKSTC